MSARKSPKTKRQPRTIKTRSLDELVGCEFYEDSAKRRWIVRARTLGDIHLFFSQLESLMTHFNNAKKRIEFLRCSLEPVAPTAWQSVRRFFGLTYFSSREIARRFLSKDFEAALNMICRVNIDKDFQALIDDAEKAAQKKMNPAMTEMEIGVSS
jgi:hypothetical protein